MKLHALIIASFFFASSASRADEIFFTRTPWKMSCHSDKKGRQNVLLTMSSRGYLIQWPNGESQRFRTTHYHINGNGKKTRMVDKNGEIWWDTPGKGWYRIIRERDGSVISCQNRSM